MKFFLPSMLKLKQNLRDMTFPIQPQSSTRSPQSQTGGLQEIQWNECSHPRKIKNFKQVESSQSQFNCPINASSVCLNRSNHTSAAENITYSALWLSLPYQWKLQRPIYISRTYQTRMLCTITTTEVAFESTSLNSI